MFPQFQAVTRVMEPVLPGAYAVATVGGLTDDTTVYACRLPDDPDGEPGGVPDVAGDPVVLPIVQRTGECVTLDVPAGDYGLWAFQLAPAFDAEHAWVANRPRLDWAHPARATAGAPFRLIGRNLASVLHYPTVDPEHPVSCGGLLGGVTRVLARRAGESAFLEIPVERSSAYEAHLAISADLPAGAYEFFAHNGHGGPLGWSEPLAVEVAAAEPWPDTVFPVDDYIARAGNVDDGFAAALAEIARQGGGVLQLSAWVYHITRTLVLPPRMVLRGMGRERTLIQLPKEGEVKPPYVAVSGDRDFTVEDLRIDGIYAPILVCAPSLAPEDFDRAFMHSHDLVPRHARNVTLRRVHLSQTILSHTNRRADKEHVERMQRYVLGQGTEFGGFRAIFFKGDGLTMEDCEVWGGGTCIHCNRSTHVHLARNVLRAGPAGYGFHTYSRLLWPEGHPAGSAGAKIDGFFCREILLEDNEITAYSERARGLVAISYAGMNIHFARNHIHDIEPTYDAEALLTHLWQARWTEPAIEMLSPTTARIIDPAGEVTHEWLEGAYIDIVNGRGLGQLRRITRREGDLIEIERPWRVDPNETSDIVFTAPPPFMHINYIDNRVVSKAINFILWGTHYDSVLDGNYTADGPGITLWSVRLAPDQKVWGGIIFTTVINNVMDRGWSAPATAEGALGAATGFMTFASRHPEAGTEGYDLLGVVFRGNHITNNSGAGLRVTFLADRRNHPAPWRSRDGGIVLENNLCTDTAVGIAIEDGARTVERGNAFRNVRFPLTWSAPDV